MIGLAFYCFVKIFDEAALAGERIFCRWLNML